MDEQLTGKVNEAFEIWPDASREELESIATRAEAIAHETAKQGNEEEWSYAAGQTSYGCDWSWQEQEDEPTARVYDCDGTTIEHVR